MDGRRIPGILLRLERLKQGKGQREVCLGLCVPSYLSKIEHGTVLADAQLVRRLFERLSIQCETDAQKLERAGQLVEAYYQALSLFAPETKDIYRQFRALGEGVAYSALALDWLIIEGMQALNDGSFQRAYDVAARLMPLQEHMDRRQKGYYCCLKAATVFFERSEKNIKDRQEPAETMIACYQEACLCLNNALAYVWLCSAYFKAGRFMAIHEMESRITAMAVEEGNVYYLAQYYIVKGSAYASLDLEPMMMLCYQRAEKFLQNTVWKDSLNIVYYNIGATLTALGQFDRAMRYLERVPEETYDNLFELLHKKALICLRSGRIKPGKAYLERAKECLEKDTMPRLSDWLRYEEAEWETKKNFLDSPEYLDLMLRMMDALKKERGFGFRYFYREQMVAVCERQRKYKLALAYQRELSSKLEE